MIDQIILTFWLFLPGGVANMAPIFAKHLPYLRNLDAPIDSGKNFHGKRILGDHKTWRGLIAGVLVSTLISYILYLFSPTYSSLLATYYSSLLFGLLTGFGALFGDGVKSFFKRRVGIKSGKAWIPFDQIDYVLGIILFGSFVLPQMLKLSIYAIPLFIGLHFAVSYVGYLLKLKDEPV